MKKELILILVIIVFVLILLVYLCKQKINTETAKSVIERNEIEPSSFSQYDAISHKNLFKPEKVSVEPKPVEEEKEVIVLEKPEIQSLDDIRGEEDSNGVRHDVNLWIAEQPITYNQKLALIQKARCLQNELVQSERLKKLDVETARKEASVLADESMKAIKCIGDQFDDQDDPYKFTDQLRKLILNTKERSEASESVDKAFSGGVIYYPKGDTCEG